MYASLNWLRELCPFEGGASEVAKALSEEPFAKELLRLQMLADMGEGGKVIVLDAQNPGTDVALRES